MPPRRPLDDEEFDDLVKDLDADADSDLLDNPEDLEDDDDDDFYDKDDDDEDDQDDFDTLEEKRGER